MRTRMSPSWQVRQWATPLAPGCSTAATWVQSVASNGEEAAYLYGAKAGRISVEFQAAELMAAYLESHSNVEIFHEDDVDLIPVFQYVFFTGLEPIFDDVSAEEAIVNQKKLVVDFDNLTFMVK